MVSWFSPGMLVQTGLRALISGVFGNYADRREMEAALGQVTEEEWKQYADEYGGRKEIWIDYISDTGDGFNSTFSIARLAAQPELPVTQVNGETAKLPRAKLLLMGGDQVYPTPGGGLYKQKLSIPYDAAFPEQARDSDRPDLYAIPGNHDWYDGLSGFLKLFCQQRRIGNWQTRQHRSYFARPLPHQYWIWGTDIQLHEDIDQPQLSYFRDIARHRMKPGDQVILITAEPAWIYKELIRDDETYARFKFFIDTCILAEGIEIATMLSGDMHHYSHYCTDSEGHRANHYFGCGGGGAFLHLTHNLPSSLNTVVKGLSLQKTFPDKEDSYKLLYGNLAFLFKNYTYALLMASLYGLFFWLLSSSLTGYESILNYTGSLSFTSYVSHLGFILSYSPFLCMLSLLIVAGFWKFTDTTSTTHGMQWMGALHGLIQCISIYALLWGLGHLHLGNTVRLFFLFVVLGGVWGSSLMGIYLLVSNLIFSNHIDEASSSLACEDFKSFLRMHISAEGLTIYPIGVRSVTRNWSLETSGEHVHVTGTLPVAHLIEDPVLIKKCYEKTFKTDR